MPMALRLVPPRALLALLGLSGLGSWEVLLGGFGGPGDFLARARAPQGEAKAEDLLPTGPGMGPHEALEEEALALLARGRGDPVATPDEDMSSWLRRIGLPVLAATPSASGEEEVRVLTLSKKDTIFVAERILPRLRGCCMHMKPRFDSLSWSEALGLLSAAILTKVDVILESGTASGHSAELMARFFEGSPMVIYTIDKDAERRNDTEAAAVRLSAFPAVRFVPGDSILEIPRLLGKHRGSRIGVFIDGPKLDFGLCLGLRTLRSSSDVTFVAVHDLDKVVGRPDITGRINAWRRVILRTWAGSWRKAFGSLDGCSEDLMSNCGFGLAVLAGTEAMAFGVQGDLFYPKETIKYLLDFASNGSKPLVV